MQQIHVSHEGSDAYDGSLSTPVATLKMAQKLVRQRTSTMQSDITVLIHSGLHILYEPLVFDSTLGDSGENGYQVVYQAYDPSHPAVISGGKRVESWQLYDKNKNIWCAEVGNLIVRQLYVNNHSASRAELKVMPEFTDKNEAGYVVDLQASQQWGNVGDIEFRYAGVYPWSEAIVGVQSAIDNIITMKQPAFAWANKLYKSTMPDTEEWSDVNQSAGLDAPTSILNGLGFLSEPGTFVFDSRLSGAHKVYYIPQKGEDMAAAECIVPVLETLIEGQGTVDSPLHDITFRNLTFAHATWLKPSSSEGYIHYHGVSYYEGGRVQSFEWSEGASVTIPIQYKLSPSAITWKHTNNILFEGNHFTHMGTGALAFSVGSSGNVIRSNIFEDSASTGLTIGTESSSHKPGSIKTANNRIQQNKFNRLGTEFHGSPAVLIVKTQDTHIDHNEVVDMPHAGIVVYGGGKTKGLRITNNYIARTMQVLADGGGIYISTSQGTSPESGAEISGNVVEDTVTPYNFAIYTDYGADWTIIHNNIIRNADNPVAIQTAPPLSNVTVKDNFWDSQPYGIDAVPPGVTLINNTVISKGSFEEDIRADDRARSILDAAGI